jgi:hypothetical protein
MENLKDALGFIISIGSVLPAPSHDLDILSLPVVGKETVEITQITGLTLNNFFLENVAFYDIMSKNFVQRGRP